MTDQERLYEKELHETLAGNRSADTYNYNYLIEAGAGAGKTYILTNRIVNQLLTDDTAPEDLVAITFTEKATQEMISRIDREFSDRLAEEVAANGEGSDLAVKLKELSDSVAQMQISTIHSFCRTLLMTMPFHSGLGPEFEVMDDTGDCAKRFFAMKLREDPETFSVLHEQTGITYELLQENFLNLCETRAEIPYAPLTEEQRNQLLEEMRTPAGLIWTKLQEDTVWSEQIEQEACKTQTVMKMISQIHAALDLRLKTKDAAVESILAACNPCSPWAPFSPKAIESAEDQQGKRKENAISSQAGCRKLSRCGRKRRIQRKWTRSSRTSLLPMRAISENTLLPKTYRKSGISGNRCHPSSLRRTKSFCTVS